MTQDDVHLLVQYDGWATMRILHQVGALTPEQFARDLGGAFPSVRDVLLHIIASKWSWLTYWKESSPSDHILTDVFVRSAILFHAERVPTLAAVQEKCDEVEKEYGEFLNGVTNDGLARPLPVRNISISLAHLVQHVANHSTYHRGQIALMLRQLGAPAQCTDFAEFLLAAGDGATSTAS